MHITFTMSASSAPKLCVQLTDSDDAVEQRLGLVIFMALGSSYQEVKGSRWCNSEGAEVMVVP